MSRAEQSAAAPDVAAQAARSVGGGSIAAPGAAGETAPPGGMRGKVVAAASGLASLAALGVVTVGLLAGGGDRTPDQAELAAMRQTLVALQTEGLAVTPVAAEERDAALAAMALPEQDRDRVAASVASGATALVWVTLWDNFDEDGDVVRIESDWMSINVPILNAVTRVAVPQPASGVINLRGVADGGGGVTLAFIVGETSLPLPPMGVGQAIGIKVR